MADYDAVRRHIQDTLDVAVRSGYGSDARLRSDLIEQVRDEFREEDRATIDAEVERFTAELAQATATQLERESTWLEPTINDRIDAAFLALERQGIVALQDAGYTMSDGWEDIGEARRAVDGAWAGVFFHRQDVERAVDGGGLMLAFGAFVDGDTHESESLRVAKRTCEVLAAHEVSTEWDGTIRKRIAIPPFEWRKRRWTAAPR